MSVFHHYARYYDLLYREKDYETETRFVHEQLLRGGRQAGRLLELGCGTGKHAVEFARLGWAATGYDLSDGMVELARERAAGLPAAMAANLQFTQGDVRTVRNGQRFDAVISLFHVMSYLTTAADLGAALGSAAAHLEPGGRVFFDFWYGPAVLSDPPAVRVKRLSDDRIEATRLAEPELRVNENVVLVHYHIFIKDRSSGAVSELRETHRLRYWFLPELEQLLGLAGFRLSESGRCYAEHPLGIDTWYGWALAEKA